MNKRLCILLALFATVFAAIATPPAARITATLDSTVVTMGSQLKLNVRVSVPVADAAGIEYVNFPEITNPELGYGEYNGVQVIAVDTASTIADDRTVQTFDYTLQAFDPGLLTLPPLGIIPAPGADTIFSGHFTLKVLAVDVDTVNMVAMPLAPVVNAHMRWHDYVPLWIVWVLAAIIIIAAGILLWLKFRTRKQQIAIQKKKPVPPYELAIRRLDNLRKQGLAASGHEKEFYTELTDILRQYLHGRFGINAMEMTSSQIVRTLRSNPDTRMPAEQMDAVLRVADFVKFAKERPLADDNERAMMRATDFVNTTKPAPVPAEGENGKPATPGAPKSAAPAPARTSDHSAYMPKGTQPTPPRPDNNIEPNNGKQ